MFYFFFPVGTSAPLYYRPWATGAMVIVNIAFFILSVTFPNMDWLTLHFDVINPISWFTVHLMHADAGHLIGNMIFLVLCGLILEGRLGWLRFIFLYFAIGLTMAAPFQVVMFILGVEGSCLGASCVISGMIVIAMLWAPDEEISLFYFGVIFFRPFVGTFQVSVVVCGFCLIGLDFIEAAFRGFQISTSVLHLLGVVAGIPFAYFMVKFRQVNCEGKDMFSLWSGNYGKVVLTHEEEKRLKEEKKRHALESKQKVDHGIAKVNFYIDNGHYDFALKRFNMLSREQHDLRLTESQLVKIIKGFDKDPNTKHKVVPVIKTYLEDYNRYRIPFTLMLARAQIISLHRPRQGLITLKTLTWGDLKPNQQAFVRKLIEKAKVMIADGVLEVD